MFTPEKILLLLFALMFAVGAADYLCGAKCQSAEDARKAVLSF